LPKPGGGGGGLPSPDKVRPGGGFPKPGDVRQSSGKKKIFDDDEDIKRSRDLEEVKKDMFSASKGEVFMRKGSNIREGINYESNIDEDVIR